jgi:hypothetical protein
VVVLQDLLRAGRFTPVASYQRFAYLCAALLVLSGLFHAGVFLVAGGAWQGPVSWRKPTVFGLSFGITVATISWFMSFLRPRRATGWLLLGVLATASVGEVLLISLQRWRGVASHFNEDTALDAAVFSAMGTLVSLVGLVVVAVALRSWFPMDAPPSLAWAIRAGLVLLLVSQAVGVQMIVEGGNTYGAAGALKVPHAVTMHAAQVLPALAVLLAVSEYSEHRRLRVVGLAVLGYAGLIAAVTVQAYAGRGPLDPGPASTVLALAGLVLLGVSAAMALQGVYRPWRAAVRGPVRS